MELIFIRHGDPDYEHDCLTEIGQEQVKALKKYFKHKKYDAYYVSPMGRAHLTAKGVTSEENFIVKDWLKEFVPPLIEENGKKRITWDNYTSRFDSNKDYFDNDKSMDTEPFKSAETKKYYDEVIKEFDALLAGYGYVRENGLYKVTNSNKKKLVFVCHFGITCVLMSRLMGVPYLVLGQHLCATPSSITSFITEEREKGIAHFRCLYFGATPHLDKLNMKPSFHGRFCETFDSDERH